MSKSEKEVRPFDKDYVLRVTAQHMLKSIDISIGKTFERSKEFGEDPAKQNEVFETLSELHNQRKIVSEHFLPKNSKSTRGV